MIKSLYKIFVNFKHQLFFSVFGFSYVCHQQPSCSEYTLIQIKKNGTIIGLIQGLWRVLHCR